MDFERNQKYFKGISYAGVVWLFVLSGILLVAGIWLWPLLIVSVLLSGWAVAALIVKKKSYMTDAMYDEAVETYTKFLPEYVLPKLGVEPEEVNEAKPMQFGGYSFFPQIAFVKYGADGFTRTNRFERSILFFSRDALHCYYVNVETCFPNQPPIERTTVYFYTDIVSCSTQTESVQKDGKIYTFNTLRVTNKSGNHLSFTAKDSPQFQQSVNALRALLKEKKNA